MKTINGINDIRYISITMGLNPDNIESIYNKRLQFFYFSESGQKEITNGEDFIQYDDKGNITNATFNKTYKTGLPIPETTFIENQLNQIEKTDLTKLSNEEKDLVRFYKKHLENKLTTLSTTPNPKQEGTEVKNSEFSVLEWATIFYYADATKLLTDDKTIKARAEKFMAKHNISTTFKTFKNNYNAAKRRINVENNYPISKLNKIIPFVKNNYNLSVTKIENEKTFLQNENPDY